MHANHRPVPLEGSVAIGFRMGGKGRLPQHRKVAIGIGWGRQLDRDLVALRGEAHIAARGEALPFGGHAGIGRLPAPTAPQIGKQRIDRLRHRQTQGQHLRPGKVQRGLRHQQAQGGLPPGRPRKHQLRAAQHARQPGAMHRPGATEGHQREVPRSLAATDRHRARGIRHGRRRAAPAIADRAWHGARAFRPDGNHPAFPLARGCRRRRPSR